MWGDRSGRIRRDGPWILWQEVRDDLLRLIGTGALAPGEKIPGEIDLADIYGVGRITARHAVRDLVERGLLVSVTGRGTFVAVPPDAPG